VLHYLDSVVEDMNLQASGDDAMSQFREAVDKGDIHKAVELYRSNWGFDERNEMFNYVFDKKDQGFIFKFAKKTGIAKDDLLLALHRKTSAKIVEEAFKVFKFSQDNVKTVASRPELMCSPDSLFNLLGKIKSRRIRNGLLRRVFGICFLSIPNTLIHFWMLLRRMNLLSISKTL